MPNEDLDKTRAEPNLEVLTAEDLKRQDAEKARMLAEARATVQRLRDEEQKEKDEAFRRLRAAGLATEEGRLQSREVMEVSDEQMEEARFPIRVEQSRRSGVLGTGEAASESSNAEYRMAGRSAASETNFVGTDMSEGENRAEPMAVGMSLADLQRQDVARKPSARAKSALRLSDIGPVKGSGIVPEDLDIEGMLSTLKAPSVPPPPPNANERAA
jgi:hypothetical protein